MIRRGWNHETLMRMPEVDFGFWLEAQLEYDRAEAEARRKAVQKGR